MEPGLGRTMATPMHDESLRSQGAVRHLKLNHDDGDISQLQENDSIAPVPRAENSLYAQHRCRDLQSTVPHWKRMKRVTQHDPAVGN